MNMSENLRKLLNRFAFVAVAATLAACSADELTQGGDAALPQPGGATASSGTVNFTNNTSMTIGNGLPGGTRTAWLTRGATFDMADNAACTLAMPEQPGVGDASSIGSDFPYENVGNVIKPAVIEAGITKRIGQGGEDMRVNNLDADLFVMGTLNVENVRSDSKQGRIIVLEGGTVNFNMEKLAGVAILNYGGTVNLTKANVTIDAGAAIMTDGGLGCGDCAINVAGKLYVGGDLTCKRVAAEVGGALVHVLGNLTAVPYINEAGNYTEDGSGQVEISGESDVCVEGVTNVYRFMASRGANVHTDCKLIATDDRNTAVNITNGATLCASYVETAKLHVSGGQQGAAANVYLSDKGVMNIKQQLAVGANSHILPYGEGGTALVSAETIYVEDQIKWADVFDGNLYVNYETIDPESATPDDTSKHNVATIGAGGECSPGFTVPGTDPDPEPTPGGDGDIVIVIPDDVISDEYTLKQSTSGTSSSVSSLSYVYFSQSANGSISSNPTVLQYSTTLSSPHHAKPRGGTRQSVFFPMIYIETPADSDVVFEVSIEHVQPSLVRKNRDKIAARRRRKRGYLALHAALDENSRGDVRQC